MVRSNRNDILADYYLRAAGVAAVWIDADGHVGAQDVASIEVDPDRTVYCCELGVHFTLAYRLYEWKREAGAKRRLADEYDAAQERGEVAKAGDPRPSKREGLATVEQIGLTHKEIHEARIIRDAEAAKPGVVRRTVNAAAIAAKLEDLAERGGVSLTPHAIAVALGPSASGSKFIPFICL